MYESSISISQIAAVLDNAPVAVYVSALDNWELLYANRLAEEFKLKEADKTGKCCYQMAGFDAPCSFCRIGEMSRTKLLVREFRHPINGRIYQMSGKLIDWAGREAHIEYIIDITEKKIKEEHTKAVKEELQTIFGNVPCGLCVYQLENENISPLFHNPAFYDIMGYSEEHIHSVEQQTDYLGVHHEDVDALQEKIREAVRCNGLIQHTYRLWNDREMEYRWIRLDGSVKSQSEGKKFLYAVYSDVSEQMHLEEALKRANDKMQDTINAIPGGVAIYKVTDIFETVYFSDGVPALSGYTVEEYQKRIKRDAAELIYHEDKQMVVSALLDAANNHTVVEFDFRKQHREGHIVWVHIQAKQIGEEDGCPLIHCVFHNISTLKETQLELDHLINSIPGGIASYRVESGRFIPTFFSDGVPALSGHTRAEYEAQIKQDALDIIYVPDRERVLLAIRSALRSGAALDVSYRMYHKNGSLIWIHLNGRRMSPEAETMRFYAVFTGMSAETRLFQNIANETADGIYVIDKNNYDLLYVNESKDLTMNTQTCSGGKCYTVLHGKDTPCAFCTIKSHAPDGIEHEMAAGSKGRYYNTRFWETDWNGIPAYVKYVRDVTEEVTTRKEKEKLEQYFQTVVKNLPGGIAVVRYEKDGNLVPEFLSEGFAAMTGMSLDEAWRIYDRDAMEGVHPEDRAYVKRRMEEYAADEENQCQIIYRLKRGSSGYVWVKNNLTLIESAGGERRVYAVYHDVTKEREEQEQIRRQYKELILQHYRTPGPDVLVIGHCNITQRRIIEINDFTNSGLLDTFGSERDGFFTGLSTFIVDKQERQDFLAVYLSAPALKAFQEGITERRQTCFIKLPAESVGRYVQFKMNMVAEPDSEDVTGILTVADITEQTVSERILHNLSGTGNDLVIDVDLIHDTFTVLSYNADTCCMPPKSGKHSEWTRLMLQTKVVPRDQEQYQNGLDPETMTARLRDSGPYTFAFSAIDDNGDIRTKNMTVSAIDLRIGRICLSRTDITDSIREQQGLLRVIAYTFELAGFIDIGSRRLTLYTRETVLENLAPYIAEDYNSIIDNFIDRYGAEEERATVQEEFMMNTMLCRMEERPSGYDFIFPYRTEEGTRYKQINVMWGDANHRTLCMVRADVTEMLAAERKTKKELEDALAGAREANRAKSDFLSAMSHDIRTPMNAIMGMTALAVAHMDDRTRVSDCLQKISVSSKHLLSLVNDILDMSKIERSKISLNNTRLSIFEVVDQVGIIIAPQARAAGLKFITRNKRISHEHFYGDSLRINQILLNILGNAVKFTPEGGRVELMAEEIPPLVKGQVRYRFTVSDTGIGIPAEFLAHIFEHFTRGRTSEHIEGTGLGLSITKGLVDLMGGKISVTSQERKGTTFEVELEYEPVPDGKESGLNQKSPTADTQCDQLFDGCHFLVAEDNAINAEILCELLKIYGAHYDVKADGKQAAQAFFDMPPGSYDAILMDIQMPEMNGYEATRAIRESGREDAQTIPIIAMTANAFAEDIQASIDAGMDAHVAKPIDMDVMCETLCRLLKR